MKMCPGVALFFLFIIFLFIMGCGQEWDFYAGAPYNFRVYNHQSNMEIDSKRVTLVTDLFVRHCGGRKTLRGNAIWFEDHPVGKEEANGVYYPHSGEIKVFVPPWECLNRTSFPHELLHRVQHYRDGIIDEDHSTDIWDCIPEVKETCL